MTVEATSRREKAPVPRAVEVVARDEQQPVLLPVRQRPVQRVDDEEEDDEVKGIEDHGRGALRILSVLRCAGSEAL